MKRRHFLTSSTFFVIAAPTGALAVNPLREPQRRPSVSNTRYLFPQGVASGDPRDVSIVFWTRCVATEDSAEAIAVRLDVSTEPDFATTVARVRLNALPLYDFIVRENDGPAAHDHLLLPFRRKRGPERGRHGQNRAPPNRRESAGALCVVHVSGLEGQSLAGNGA
ncbi:PhoD-like phosphatase N-terminal domain-containing protein, partial [Paraburkholderia hospita]|uniref:PhoD-like phosphatase N-terminal domain-containing protein n=1 Tax=Paraburkholderia hospita TaxID=169430 RepID=UPI001F617EDE